MAPPNQKLATISNGLLALLLLNCVALTCVGQTNFTNNGTFATGTTPARTASADYDLDGDLDIAVVNSGDATLQVFDNVGGLTFTAGQLILTGPNPTDVEFVDVNGDGFLDLVVCCRNSHDLRVYTNDTLGSFGAGVVIQAGFDPYSFTVFDYDNDNDLSRILDASSAVFLSMSVCTS